MVIVRSIWKECRCCVVAFQERQELVYPLIRIVVICEGDGSWCNTSPYRDQRLIKTFNFCELYWLDLLYTFVRSFKLIDGPKSELLWKLKMIRISLTHERGRRTRRKLGRVPVESRSPCELAVSWT